MSGVHVPILRTLAAHPRRVAAVDDRRAYRGIDLIGGALHVARALDRRTRGPVGIMVPTSGIFPISALAAWMLGRVVVPLNYLLSRDELQYIVDDAALGSILTVGPMLDHLGFAPKVPELIPIDDLPMKGLPPLRWPRGAGADDLACLLYTSGTGGRPKGVMLTHGNLSANVAQVREWVDFTPRDMMLGVLPQFHTFGFTVLTLVPLGARIKAVYSARFVPQKIVKLFREHRPTVFVAIPSMYRALLSAKDAAPEDFASLRFAVSGGEPLPDDVAHRFKERFGVTIAEGFGMTETSPVTHWCRPHEHKPHSVGPPLPRVEQRIVDVETGEDLGPDRDGELRLRGPNVMKGYYNQPEATAEAFDDRGWLRSGDMARTDADNHLYITGRIKEMLIVGGENVFPREIEEVIESHPSVAGCGVVGQADPLRGEVPVAFVQVQEGQDFDERALIGLCRERLAGYKVPRRVVALDQLPRSGTGKVLRRVLKQRLAEHPPA